ncbi:hypothetical protein [Vibrio cholerae]|uniref:hypothetical protein n=1 Tax=Vibrio cholerae TaxID=666 RepID=UPI0030181CB9
MVAVVAFEFGVMRCQPLRRALALKRKKVIFRTLSILAIIGSVLWFISEPSPEPAVVFVASLAAFFRDEVHGIIGAKFVSLSSRAAPIRDFQHYKYSFVSDNYISPAILDDLNGWVSDVGDQIVSINISDANQSNRYFGKVDTRHVSGTFPVVDYKSDDKYLSYQYVGCSFSGVHILKLVSNYGGSGYFHSLLLVTVMADSCIEFESTSKAIKKERFVIKKVGTIPLGDRYDGTVTYRLGFLTISACKGLKALRTKHERVFIL